MQPDFRTCFTCGYELEPLHYHAAHSNRTCFHCFAKWLGVPLPEAARAMALHSLKLYSKLAREARRP